MDKKSFGQVFTSDIVAEYMVNMLNPDIVEGSIVMDPCIGKNIFLDKIDLPKNGSLIGIEIDSDLIDEDLKDFYSGSDRNLYNQDFFDYSTENKADIIIMNPPYVRQEELNQEINNKKKLREVLGAGIPQNSNLYVYFILKAIDHLNEGGKMAVITYDSWLFTSFGEDFKRRVMEKANFEKVIHFKKDAFDDVDIGATILLISKPVNTDRKIDYISLENPLELEGGLSILKSIDPKDFLNFNPSKLNSRIDFERDFFIDLEEISYKPILRGTNAIVNKFFLFDTPKFGEDTKEIIKSIIQIKNFSVLEGDKYILYPKKTPNSKIKKYLNTIQKEVKSNPEVHRTLLKNIKEKKEWYIPNILDSGDILFNYYLRKNIDFIYNPNKISSSDNFYNIFLKEYFPEYMAILNSSFTKISIIKNSRMQGMGLLKIQLNNFKKVKVFDLSKLNKDTQLFLREKGMELMKNSRSNSEGIIKDIDEILLSEYNLKLDENLTRIELMNEIKEDRGF